MAVISGTIGAYTRNLLYSVPTAQTPYTIPIGFPDVFQGVLSEIAYTNGTGSLQLDLAYSPAPITLVSTTSTIDLTSLTDIIGIGVNFARVREFMVYNPDPTAGHDLIVEAGASNGWSFAPVETVRYGGGFYRKSDPTSTGGGNGNVTGGSSKTVKFDSGAHTITFWVLILGGSAA